MENIKPLTETTKKALMYLVQIEGITQTYDPVLKKVDFMEVAEAIGLPPEVTMSEICNSILKELNARNITIAFVPDKKDKNCIYIGLRPILLNTHHEFLEDGLEIKTKDRDYVAQVVNI
ncbi:hypothetical protein [Guptibacillus spartinae]|uniref:hypothetical protein n=1 Tax=Guptibacillus spartinae TaxID=3025679 RepID=UPI00235E7F92|nr:hypothetical protein [Pseudalkalibacillus spartinae]